MLRMVHGHRVYLESTVWYQLANYSGSEFKNRAQQLIELLGHSDYTFYVSTLVLEELAYNSRTYRLRVEDLLRKHRPVVIVPTTEAEMLAEAYVENAFPKRERREVLADAMHAAVAVTAGLTYMASYNWRNLLNVHTLAHINGINLIAGHNRQLAILPPFMFLSLEQYEGEKGTVDKAVWKLKSEYGKDLQSLLGKKPDRRTKHYEEFAQRAQNDLGLQVVRLGEIG
jgi:predicted nucleic acid-binding protein